jgi:hypothetical protein
MRTPWDHRLSSQRPPSPAIARSQAWKRSATRRTGGRASTQAILMAFESIFIKRLATKDAPLAMLPHFNGLGCLLMLVPAVLTWREVGPALWIAGLSLGPLFAQYCNIRGFRIVDMAVAARSATPGSSLPPYLASSPSARHRGWGRSQATS